MFRERKKTYSEMHSMSSMHDLKNKLEGLGNAGCLVVSVLASVRDWLVSLKTNKQTNNKKKQNKTQKQNKTLNPQNKNKQTNKS